MKQKVRMPELITYSDEEMDRKIKEARHGLTPEQTHVMWMQAAEKWMTEQAEKKKEQQQTTSDNPLE